MTADLILCNLKAVTFAQGGAAAELIAIKGNKIVYAGAETARRDLRGSHTRVLDCEGGLVVPGFNDAHCHPLAFAITLRYVDCSGVHVHRIADIQTVLRERARAVSGEQWIRGAMYEVAALAEKRPPNRWELDQAVPHLPVVLVERSGEHCVLNSRALERCGIADAPGDPAGDSIHCDPATGLPDGMISGSSETIAKAIPPLSDDEIEAGMKEANGKYLSLGITSLQDTTWSNDYGHWLAMKRFKDRGVLAPRVTLFTGFDGLESFAQRGLKTGSGDDQLRLGGAKIALDQSTGNPRPPQEDLNCAALRAHLAGFQLAFHVSDVYMLQISLQALEFVRRSAAVDCIRPRFEHCPVCPPALVPEIARSGAMVISQPNLLHSAGPRYLQEISEEQLKWVAPFKSFLQHGIQVAFSSDSPLTPCNPHQAIHTAVTRVVEGGARLGVDESVPFAAALRMYTCAGAYASLEEETKGSIAVGQLADLTVLDRESTQLSAEALADAKVRLTVIDGQVVWER